VGKQAYGDMRSRGRDYRFGPGSIAKTIVRHGKTSCDTCADLQPLIQPFGPKICHRGFYRQGRSHGPLGVVLMSMRVAEKNEHAIDKVTRDEATISLDRLVQTGAASRCNFAERFGIEA
jgi:hypothetical protein